MKPYPFQEKAAEWLASKKRAVLGSEVGTGKTVVAITAAKKVKENKVVYVVVPSFLKTNWLREVKFWRQTPKS